MAKKDITDIQTANNIFVTICKTFKNNHTIQV